MKHTTFVFLFLCSCQAPLVGAPIEIIDVNKVQFVQEQALEATKFCEASSINACKLIAGKFPMAFMAEKPVLTCSQNKLLFSNIICDEDKIIVMRGMETEFVDYDWVKPYDL